MSRPRKRETFQERAARRLVRVRQIPATGEWRVGITCPGDWLALTETYYMERGDAEGDAEEIRERIVAVMTPKRRRRK